MQQMIDLARGPLFALTFGMMMLGLLRLVVIQIYLIAVGKGRRLQKAPWRRILGETITWAFPFRHLIKGTIIFSSASFISHIGLIIVPLFLVDHIVLWEAALGLRLPSIGPHLADILTLTTLVCLGTLLVYRLFHPRHRAVSQPIDYGLLLAVMLPFATGFLASHPQFNPFRWDVMMLAHLLSAELLFLLVPFTKLAHVVLFAFDRISEIHWQLRPGAGDKVAAALYGNEVKI
jgi:nitrate reductase gamma subunit